MVTHAGQTPNRKKNNTNFLCAGKFMGTMGQFVPSLLYSLIPHTLIDSFIVTGLTKEVIRTAC